MKGETPTSAVLATVRGLLAADTSPGQKYILLVTDGQPDYCNDGSSLCPVDSVVRELQVLYAAGIPTFVFGIQSALADLPAPTLQAFANAGAGQPVAAIATPASSVYLQCSTVGSWVADYNAAGRTGQMPAGDYTTTGGTAMVYKPDPSSPQALTDLIAGTVAAVQGCGFTLSNGKIDPTKLANAHVVIQGQEIPQGATNGWSVPDATHVQLNGSACTLYQQPQSTIAFKFPCDAISTP
jgi:hypothetical protein